MSTSKGRMLARTGWQGWACSCCDADTTNGRKRAQGEREWRREAERELATGATTKKFLGVRDESGRTVSSWGSLPESKLARYREILANRPRRDPAQDLSWELEEYEASKPSIVRAMKLEDGSHDR